MSAIHAYRARKTFISSILHGEAAANLAQAAMAVAAEDDAIGTTVEEQLMLSSGSASHRFRVPVCSCLRRDGSHGPVL